MIEVVEVKTKKQQREFVNFPLKLYKGNPYFVPPLYIDEIAIFKKDYVYNEQCKCLFLNAYEDGKMVGRIEGIVQIAANTKWKQNRVRFTRFDSINKQEVANALFQRLEEWAISNNFEEVVGPLGYSDLEREGLLIEGFDELSTYEEQYNYPYYQSLIENLGYTKDVDWTERKIFAPKQKDERLESVSNHMLEKYNLHVVTFKNVKELLNNYADDFIAIIDETYKDIYGTVPFSEKMKQQLISNFKLILNVRYFEAIADENNKLVCFAICLPSIAEVMNKCHGHLNPVSIVKLLKSIRHPKVIDLGLIGVVDEYKNKGISTFLISGLQDMLLDGEVEYAETNLNLEDNYAIQNLWKRFETVQHKRRRCFIKKIK